MVNSTMTQSEIESSSMQFPRQVVSVFVARLLTRAVRMVNSIISARWLGPEGMGYYALFFTLASNLRGFVELGLGRASVYHIRRKNITPTEAADNATVFSAGAGLLAVGLVFLFRRFLSEYLLDSQELHILLLAAIIPLIMLSKIFSTMMRGLNRFDLYNISELLIPVVTMMGFVTGLIVLGAGATGAIVSQVLAIGVGALWLVIKMRHLVHFRIRLHFSALRDSLDYGIRSHVLDMIMMTLSALPIYILKTLTGSALVAQYSVILSLLSLISFIRMSISLTLFPKVSSLSGQRMHEFVAAVSRHTLLLTTGASIFTLAFGPLLIRLLYGMRYEHAARALPLFLPGVIFDAVGVMLMRDFTARERPIQGIPIFAYTLGMLTKGALSIPLVTSYPEYGLEIVGIVNGLSYFVPMAVLLFLFLRDSGLRLRNVCLVTWSDLLLYVDSARRLSVEAKHILKQWPLGQKTEV
jgi:O-antigen/teichoic acid export membrane protein